MNPVHSLTADYAEIADKGRMLPPIRAICAIRGQWIGGIVFDRKVGACLLAIPHVRNYVNRPQAGSYLELHHYLNRYTHILAALASGRQFCADELAWRC